MLTNFRISLKAVIVREHHLFLPLLCSAREHINETDDENTSFPHCSCPLVEFLAPPLPSNPPHFLS